MNNSLIKHLANNQFLVALLVVACIWFVIEIKEVLVILFISFIIMSTLSIFVDFLKNKGFPKILAVLITYFITVLVVIMLIVPLVPFFTVQIQVLLMGFPTYLSQVTKILNIDAASMRNFLPKDPNFLGNNALIFTGKFFTGIFSLLAIFVLSFYLTLGKEKINKAIATLFPTRLENKVLSIIYQIEQKLGAWSRGQILLSFSIGLCTWIALSLLGIPSALPLAFIAGILEIVPTVGPIISAIPAIIIALTISPGIAIAVAILYVVIQMLENNFLVPKIMERAVGLNPILVIAGVMAGGKLMGILGAFLSVPFIAVLVILLRNLTVPKSNH